MYSWHLLNKYVDACRDGWVNERLKGRIILTPRRFWRVAFWAKKKKSEVSQGTIAKVTEQSFTKRWRLYVRRWQSLRIAGGEWSGDSFLVLQRKRLGSWRSHDSETIMSARTPSLIPYHQVGSEETQPVGELRG